MLYIINMTYKRQTEIKYFQATNPLIVLSFLTSVEINCKKCLSIAIYDDYLLGHFASVQMCDHKNAGVMFAFRRYL